MDTWIYEHINGLAGHVAVIDRLMVFLSHYGPFLLIAAFVFLWFWPAPPETRDRRQLVAVATVIGVLLALGANQLVVHLWARPRPFVSHAATMLVAKSTDPSFPSDHAAFAVAAACGLLLGWRRLGLVAAVLAVGICFSRVYVGAHYPGDVLAGALIGCVFALLTHSQARRLSRVVRPVLARARRYHLA